MVDPSVAAVGASWESFGRALVGWVGQLNFWTALLLAGALLFDRTLSRRTRASWRIALYAPVALRVLVPLGVSVPLASARVDTIVAPLFRVGALTEIVDDTSFAPSWYALAAAVYVVVAIVLAARAVALRVRLHRALREAHAVSGLELALPCEVLQHAHHGPMAVGLLAPRIVIPRDLLEEQNAVALRCVLRHEAAHLRRRDAWLSAAMLLVAIVAWPVLPIWFAMARVHQLIELACDEKALEGADGAERRRYAHALLDIAESRSFAVVPLGAGGLHFGSTLRARVEALAAQHHWPLAAQALGLSLAPLALFLACGGVTPPPGYGYEFAPQKANSASTAAFAATPTGPEGRLVPEAIEAVVLGNLSAISSCYQVAPRKNGPIAGQVTVRFVIGEDGSTRSAADEGSTLPDRSVVECVVGVFRKLRYPASRDGNVTVVYPIELGS